MDLENVEKVIKISLTLDELSKICGVLQRVIGYSNNNMLNIDKDIISNLVDLHGRLYKILQDVMEW